MEEKRGPITRRLESSPMLHMRLEGELSDFDECSWHAAVGIAFVDIQLQILVWDVVFKPCDDRG